MAMRHKAIKATLDTGYATEWNDDHIHDFTDDLAELMLILGHALNSYWDFAQTAGGSNPAWAMVGAAGAEHAFVVLNTGGVTNQISSMRTELGAAVANITSPGDLPILTCSVDIAAVHDAAGVANSVVEFGFQDDSDALFTVNQDHAIFRVYDGKIHAVTGDGAAETETEIAAYNQYGNYRIEFTTGHVLFYVDNMATAAADHTANLPDAAMTVKFSVRSKNNVDSTIRVDGVGLTRLRKQ